MDFGVFVQGLLLGLSLIVAIGAQNAFVLRQGLRREHVFVVCLVCAVSDASLIGIGVSGFGALGKALPQAVPAMRYGGIAFLLFYGVRAFIAAWHGGGGLSPLERGVNSRGRVVLTTLAFTWLNPHVYLDTVVLLGSVSAQYDGRRLWFGLGAAAGSLLFFFALGYGARLLRPLFALAVAWRVLDFLIGCIMLAIAFRLLRG